MMVFTGLTDRSLALSGRLLKSARAIRVLRLLRITKATRVINQLYDSIQDEMNFILVNLAKLLILVLLLSHIVACGWYFTGRICLERGGPNWIDTAQLEEESQAYK